MVAIDAKKSPPRWHGPARYQVDQRGIAVLDHLMLHEVLVDNGRCYGAVGCTGNRGDIYIVRAHATILATGGGAEVYAHTTYVSGVTGDGLAIPLRAGVKLVDMEFCSTTPCPCAGQ